MQDSQLGMDRLCGSPHAAVPAGGSRSAQAGTSKLSRHATKPKVGCGEPRYIAQQQLELALQALAANLQHLTMENCPLTPSLLFSIGCLHRLTELCLPVLTDVSEAQLIGSSTRAGNNDLFPDLTQDGFLSRVLVARPRLPLASLALLQKLDVSNQIGINGSSLAELSDATALTSLNVSGCRHVRIEDVAKVRKSMSLRHLSVEQGCLCWPLRAPCVVVTVRCEVLHASQHNTIKPLLLSRHHVVQYERIMAQLRELDMGLKPDTPLCTMAGAPDALSTWADVDVSWDAPQLTKLDVSGRHALDGTFESIFQMTNLRSLNCSSMADMIVMDGSLSRLSRLTQLTYFGARHCLNSYQPGLSGALCCAFKTVHMLVLLAGSMAW